MKPIRPFVFEPTAVIAASLRARGPVHSARPRPAEALLRGLGDTANPQSAPWPGVGTAAAPKAWTPRPIRSIKFTT